MVLKPARSIKIFYCYAHEDKLLRDELAKHLTPLKRTGQITEWHDRDIEAGTNWEREIETHISTASIILLLVSPDFINSDYCYGTEMQRALTRHRSGEAYVIPIILRPVHWERTPISQLQALPTEGRPITTWQDRDVAFWNVAAGITQVVETLITRIQQAEEKQARLAREEQERQYREAQARLAREEQERRYQEMLALQASIRNKRLRLDVAQLTDVGRKRPHNKDNMAYVIPKDPQVMARKGALFVVADGTVGHIAGEVASEIVVDTISNAYYANDSDNVNVSLEYAIKRANSLIYQRTKENMAYDGMGATCSIAVLRGNTAYVANIGNCRVYLIHDRQIQRISQVHAWIDEQLRAGLLTEEQARSHLSRNVITRYLGQQLEVVIDTFSVRLEEGDWILLCTDGLWSMVSDEEIKSIIKQDVPRESVYHLIERANESDGNDNITAVVIRVVEVGWEPSNEQELIDRARGIALSHPGNQVHFSINPKKAYSDTPQPPSQERQPKQRKRQWWWQQKSGE